ncbi:MAG: putative ABC transporter permease [Oscillospiraceae bacterium]|nr:putative ABC transporter permease [Oscillospiraceae bacterium]
MEIAKIGRENAAVYARAPIGLYGYATVFLFGGIIYSLIEVLARGYTHWSMTVTGGLCLLIMFRHFTANPEKNIFKKCLYGALIITALEFAAGCIVNLWLGWGVWDYSNLYMNVLGQICLPFMVIWYGLSFAAVWICDFLNKQLTRRYF